MEETPKLPNGLLNQLAEHSSCYLLFYFDSDGTPCYYQNMSSGKDHMALMNFIQQYVESNRLPLFDDGQDVEDGDDANWR